MSNAGGNMQTPSDGVENSFSVDSEAFKKDPIAEFTRLSGLFKKMLDDSAGIANNFSKAAEAMGNPLKDRPGSGKLGLGSMPLAAKMGVGVAVGGVAVMSMMPNTMAAVTQRLAADSFAGLSGMSSRQAITSANRLVGMGATSAMGATMASMNLFYQGGYSAGSTSSTNVMGSLAGLSAMTGMSNEAAASSVAGINSMNFLKMGVTARKPDGTLKPIGDIINQVYGFLYRGQKITKEQAALVYNPGSKGYQTLSMVAAGDAGLLQTLQAGVVARASASSNQSFSSAMSSGNPNNMLNIMGVDQSSPMRTNFKFQTSQSKLLQSSEQGLVGGYNTGLNVASAANNGLSDMANLLGPVNQGLMTLKGILQTLPNAGGVGGAISGVAGAAAGVGKEYLNYKMIEKIAGSGAVKKAGTNIFKKFFTSGIGKALALGGAFIGGEIADPAGGGVVADVGMSAALRGLAGRATGGPVGKKTPYIVGERGPELFVPEANGTIIPNHIVGRANGGPVSNGGIDASLFKALGGSSSSSNITGSLANLAAHNAMAGLLGGSKPMGTPMVPIKLSVVSGNTFQDSGTILATGTQKAWAVNILKQLGKPVTPSNIQAMTTWAAYEGGHWKNSAHYNPLNTTQPEVGATNMNSVGVKSYTSLEQGNKATIETLNNGKYGPILKALTSGNDASAVLKAVNKTPWGTHIPQSEINKAANVTLKVDVHIANASPQQAEALVHKVAKKLQDHAVLQQIAGTTK